MGFNVLDTLAKLATESGFAGFFATAPRVSRPSEVRPRVWSPLYPLRTQ